MPGMTKREAKHLAIEFAKLRPTEEPMERLWSDMIDRTAEVLPSNIGPTFREAAKQHGLWMEGR